MNIAAHAPEPRRAPPLARLDAARRPPVPAPEWDGDDDEWEEVTGIAVRIVKMWIDRDDRAQEP